MFEETAAAQQQEVQGESPDYTEGTGAVDGGLFPDSPAPERPIPQPQAHRAVIEGVTAEVAPNTGTKFLKFTYRSKETANVDNLAVWLPAQYAADPTIDPGKLSDEPTVKEDGSKGMSERAKYARAVRNSKGTGSLESFAKIAIDQGHTASGLGLPKTFAELATYLNTLCTGTEIVALLRAEGGDGDYADRLRTQNFVSFEYAENPKALKGYRKLWQE